MKTFIISSFLLSCVALFGAGPNNSMLQFTMKAVAKDISYVVFPAKQESPLDVTEEALVTAIARARTAAYQLQLVIDRKEGEFLPITVQNLPPEEQTKKLTLFASHLQKAILQIGVLESQLISERKKTDVSSRDFSIMLPKISDLDKTIKDAHAIFKPEN